MHDKTLTEARNHLLGARERLAMFRRMGQLNSNDRDLLAAAEKEFSHALDCMAALQISVSAG